MLQPEKVATPEDAVLELEDEHVRVAPPVGAVIARVTVAPLLVTVLPPES
jgi:hypothetical protein